MASAALTLTGTSLALSGMALSFSGTTLSFSGMTFALAGSTTAATAIHSTWDDSLFQLFHLKLAHALPLVKS